MTPFYQKTGYFHHWSSKNVKDQPVFKFCIVWIEFKWIWDKNWSDWHKKKKNDNSNPFYIIFSTRQDRQR